jgi:hypothetical protein
LEQNFLFEPADVVKVKNTDMATYYLTGRHSQVPVVALKRGTLAQGCSTPHRIDLSSSMIFQSIFTFTRKRKKIKEI